MVDEVDDVIDYLSRRNPRTKWFAGGIAVFLIMALAAGAMALDSAKWRGVAAANLEEATRLAGQRFILRAENEKLEEKAGEALIHAEAQDTQFQQEKDQWNRDAAASDQRIKDLEAQAEASSEATQKALDELESEMQPVVFAKVTLIVEGLFQEIEIHRGIASELRTSRNDQKDRADRAEEVRDTWKNSSETFRLANIGLNDEVETLTAESAAFERAADALDKSIKPTFGIKVKVGWPFAVLGFAAGVLLTRN